MKLVLTIILFLFIAGNAYTQTCLSYWAVGAAECKKKEKEVKKKIPKPLPPIVIKQPKQPTPTVEIKIEKKLTEKEKLNIQVEKEVDDFLQNHGKPPREFARFMINPTLENALVWAQKYDDMLKRTEETTVAWLKAQQILKEQEAGNLNIKIPELKNKRREVPNYDLGWDDVAGSFLNTKTEDEQNKNPFSGEVGFVSEGGSLSGVPQKPAGVEVIDNPDMQLREVFALLQQAQNKNNVRSEKSAPPPTSGKVQDLLPNVSMVEDSKIYVSYYFSAECPYCKKFEPGFQQVIEELGDKIEVTCVDMTPSKKDIVNIYGKVDCDWRPLMPDEMESFGIKSTPTLLVNFPGKKSVERLEGYVKTEVLRDYLKL